ncbi:hypothetical protein L1D12_15585 [Vibrio parahaemolyticus]|nr:hypothetical protein [Vibrio parahaemolyticus]MCG9636704.1 hypothetical protein [Vibrio parahaemolyticus]
MAFLVCGGFGVGSAMR